MQMIFSKITQVVPPVKTQPIVQNNNIDYIKRNVEISKRITMSNAIKTSCLNCK